MRTNRAALFRTICSAVFFLTCICTEVSAQQATPYLERTISIKFENERLDLALKQIGQAAGFTFSYNPSIFDTEKKITYSFTRKTVRQILDEIFQGTISYKIRGKHLILTKAKETSKKEEEKLFSGYVVDESTGERLENVSIYDPVTLSSAVTDSYGYFEIKLDNRAEEIRLAINKQSYTDTLVVVPKSNRRLLNIPIQVDKQKLLVAADSVSEKLRRFWNNKILFPKRPNLLNIDDTLYRDIQFSVVPFVGTNHMLSGNVINDVSFNLFGGYGRSVRTFELGGLFNINREDVGITQIAGVFNTNGGSVKGFQLAGVFNVNNGSVNGAQAAGILNANWNGIEYSSVAGVININRKFSKGAHVAGVGNLTLGDQDGPHIAGVFNIATREGSAAQVAGVGNIASRDFHGAQVAGVFNIAGKNITGSQVAGVFNITGKSTTGGQLAGVVNIAKKVNGNQLALFNFADSVKGVSVGLLSFVAKGYHKIEISADEVFYNNLSFRSGVRRFYNIFTAGAKPNTYKEPQTFWTFGYGLGTARKLTRWLFLDFDLTANQIMQDSNLARLNLLNKLYVGFDIQFSKHFSFIAGATANAHLTNNAYDDYVELFSDYTPRILLEDQINHQTNLRCWLGAKVGLRFL